MKTLIDKYNKKSAILVVSSYPDPKYGIREQNAVAWYAKKTFHTISKKTRKKFIILADIIDTPLTIKDKNLLIIRCWKRSNPFSFINILTWAKKLKAKRILIEFEFNLFGSLACTFAFPILLILLRILGKIVILELHQVLLDLKDLSGHLNLSRQGLISSFFNLSLRIFYKTVTACAHRIIVLEKELEERLSLLANPDKIAFVPIAIPTVRLTKKEYAKSKLNLPKDVFVILFFGFVTWYKGVDWLLRAFKKGRKIKLIIAGGMSPTLKNKPHYQVFYHKVLALAKKKGARITGFVDESDILLYFAAADLVIFPYRVFMSSSGPLAWTIAAKKPFILSSRLAPYFKSYDFQKASMLTYVKKEDLFFDFTSDKLQKKISFLLKNKNQLAKLESFSAKLAKMRSPKFLACRYLEQLEYDTNNSYGFIPILAKLLPRKLAYRLG